MDTKKMALAMHAPENKNLSDEEFIEKFRSLGLEDLSVERLNEIRSTMEVNGHVKNACVFSSGSISDLEFLWVFIDDHPKPKFAIVFDEKTTIDSINKASPEIRKFRRSLLPLFGSNLENHESILFELRDLKNKGMSWKQISKRLNYQGLAVTFTALEQKEPNEQVPEMLWAHLLISDYFIALGYSMDDYNVWLRDGVNALENDRLPWDLENGPFDKERIREKVRYMDERINRGQISEEPFPRVKDFLELSSFVLFQNGCYIQANSILEKKSRDQWKANQKWILEISETIKNKIETGTDIKNRFDAIKRDF